MIDIQLKIEETDWSKVRQGLHDRGYAVLPRFLSPAQSDSFQALYYQRTGYRKTVNMQRYRFGLGAYKYFDYPLPDELQLIRESVYSKIVSIANDWMSQLKIEKQFPESLDGLLNQCHKAGQMKPTPLILKYDQGGFNTLHQDLYGEVYFPIQAALFLSEPEVDYAGGEFVLTQQNPRAQSQAIVLKPKKGDMIIFTTNFRPFKGKRGYYRANMRHGVSEVHWGERYTLGVIFHDALS